MAPLVPICHLCHIVRMMPNILDTRTLPPVVFIGRGASKSPPQWRSVRAQGTGYVGEALQKSKSPR